MGDKASRRFDPAKIGWFGNRKGRDRIPYSGDKRQLGYTCHHQFLYKVGEDLFEKALDKSIGGFLQAASITDLRLTRTHGASASGWRPSVLILSCGPCG